MQYNIERSDSSILFWQERKFVLAQSKQSIKNSMLEVILQEMI